jgi:hypothetical protein
VDRARIVAYRKSRRLFISTKFFAGVEACAAAGGVEGFVANRDQQDQNCPEHIASLWVLQESSELDGEIVSNLARLAGIGRGESVLARCTPPATATDPHSHGGASVHAGGRTQLFSRNTTANDDFGLFCSVDIYLSGKRGVAGLPHEDGHF